MPSATFQRRQLLAAATGLQALGYASDTVMPTVVITAPGGRILWADETDNYRVRPEPDTYLAVLRRGGLVAA